MHKNNKPIILLTLFAIILFTWLFIGQSNTMDNSNTIDNNWHDKQSYIQSIN